MPRLVDLFCDTPPRKQSPSPVPIPDPLNTPPPTELLGPFASEIWSLVFSYATAPTLASCAAVNTAWAALALPTLYASLKLDPDHWPSFNMRQRGRGPSRQPRRWLGWDELVHLVRSVEVPPHRGCRAVPIRTMGYEDDEWRVDFKRHDAFCVAMRQTPIPVLPRVHTLRVRLNMTDYDYRDRSKAHFCPALRAGDRASTLVVYTCLTDIRPHFSAGSRDHVAVIFRPPAQWPTREQCQRIATDQEGFFFLGQGLIPREPEQIYKIDASWFAEWLPPNARVTIVFSDTGAPWAPEAWERAAPLLHETSRVLGATSVLTVVGAEQILQTHDARTDIEMTLSTPDTCLRTYRLDEWLDAHSWVGIFDVGDVVAARRQQRRRRRQQLAGLPCPRLSLLPPVILRLVLRWVPTSELLRYAHVNSEWAAAALPLLYETITLPSDLQRWPFSPNDTSDCGRRRWPSPTDLAPFVRRLHVEPHAGLDLDRGEPYLGCGLLWVPRLPNLHTLHLHFNAGPLHNPGSGTGVECPAEHASAGAATLVMHGLSLAGPLPPVGATVGKGRDHIACIFTRATDVYLDETLCDHTVQERTHAVLMAEACAFAQWIPVCVSRVTLLFITPPFCGWDTWRVLTLLQCTSDEFAGRPDPPCLTVIETEDMRDWSPPAGCRASSVTSATQAMSNCRRLRILPIKEWLQGYETEWKGLLSAEELQVVRDLAARDRAVL